ncbi:ER membrane protein complex subunit 6 [Holothuria leucospilota]|uniref:ER membrane protein complex subunit 6 n=1 Tax=Holothuria leucospilota TaxID=206669 RepID=A0A9Q1C1H8_HOLLE|nr:ER membrane protein complex subunit 6 [Holothuria leucospilota]
MSSDRRLEHPPSSKYRETVIFNELAIRGNMSVLNYSRTFMSAVSGAAAGILGLTGLYGFVFYFITAFCLSRAVVSSMGSASPSLLPFSKPSLVHCILLSTSFLAHTSQADYVGTESWQALEPILYDMPTHLYQWITWRTFYFYMAWFMFIEGGLASCMYRMKKQISSLDERMCDGDGPEYSLRMED